MTDEQARTPGLRRPERWAHALDGPENTRDARWARLLAIDALAGRRAPPPTPTLCDHPFATRFSTAGHDECCGTCGAVLALPSGGECFALLRVDWIDGRMVASFVAEAELASPMEAAPVRTSGA